MVYAFVPTFLPNRVDWTTVRNGFVSLVSWLWDFNPKIVVARRVYRSEVRESCAYNVSMYDLYYSC